MQPADERHDDRRETVSGEIVACSRPMGPATSQMPASPAAPPPISSASHTLRASPKPAYAAACGAWPDTSMR